MLDFYGPLLLVIGLIIIQATNAIKGKFASTLIVASLFTFSIIFIFSSSDWLFLLILVNIFFHLMAIACYFTRPRFKTF